MRASVALASAFALSLAACGGGSSEAENSAEADLPAQGETDADMGADAALTGDAARAEAEDAAIGGNVTAEDVSAAGNVALNAQ